MRKNGQKVTKKTNPCRASYLASFVCLEAGNESIFQVKFITLKMEVCCSFKALVGDTTLRLRGTSHQTYYLKEIMVLRNAHGPQHLRFECFKSVE